MGKAVFGGCTICITGALSQTRSVIEKGVEALGGATSSSVTNATTHLVANPAEYASKTKKVLAAEAKGLVIVDEGWLTACKTAGKLVDTKKFDLTTGGSGGAGQPQTAASPVKMSKAAAKALAGAGLPAPVSSAPPAPHVSKAAAKAIAKAGAAAPAPPATPPRGTKRAAPAPASPPPAPANPTPSPSVTPQKTKVGAARASADVAAKAAGTGTVDPSCPVAGATLVSGWECTLNQTDIKNNANKYYIIQLVCDRSGAYHVFTRWGRVGEPGATQVAGPLDMANGEVTFMKKFKDKTSNDWMQRATFEPKKGKYELVEMDASNQPAQAAPEAPAAKKQAKGAVASDKKCSLDAKTQDLVEWILDSDMFNSAMAQADVDVNKLPLGAISKAQVKKGFDVLEEIDAALKSGKGDLGDLSSRFYQIVPHSFGRQRPPIINNAEMLKQKFDMVAMLGDIEIAQALQADDEPSSEHPTDVKYKQLSTDLKLVPAKSPIYKTIEKYVKATEGYRKGQLLDVWEVDRQGEDTGFQQYSKLDNRRLLWHGTNVAVVAAILKSGLRIMPTASSGSRVGRGLYLASEHGKSAGYVRTQAVKGQQHGLMFLCEAAMGKMCEITRDDSSLRAAPKGFDSVLAKGRTEPDPKQDTTITIDKKKVLVPQGKPVETGVQSSFSQSEYLIYDANQQRIRYLLRFKF